jgi:DNA-binding GntR family transcriptional regulator
MSDAKTKPSDTTAEDQRLLAKLSARDRKLVEDVMAQHTELTVAEAIEALTEAGGL